jgi:hypothetical protein
MMALRKAGFTAECDKGCGSVLPVPAPDEETARARLTRLGWSCGERDICPRCVEIEKRTAANGG